MNDNNNVNHHKLIKEEFARQADSMPSASVFTDSDVVDRIKSAACITDKLRVLDVGCGPGIMTAVLAVYAREVVAFDITPEMIHRARQKCEKAGLANVQFQLGQAERLPFDDASFDVIVTRLTFHHFPDPATVISEMVRVIRPDGRIVIADIVSSEVSEEAELHNALEILRDPSHVRMIPHSELKQLVESAGLNIKEEDSWIKKREFGEWIQITNSPTRAAPLYVVMRSLAKAEVKTGIDLRFNGTTVEFNHQWLLLTAKKTD